MGFIVKAVKSVVKAVVGVVSKVVGGVFGFIVGKSAKKAKAASTLNKSLEPETGRKIVFGHTAAPLDVRYWEVYGPSAKLFDEVIAVATHRIHSFGELYCEDDIAITNAGQVVGNFAGILSRDTRLGVNNQAGMFVGSGTQWNANSTFDGVAHMLLRWNPDEKRLPNGIPSRYTQVIEGAPVYDPRRDSTVPGGSGPHRINDRDTWAYATLDGNGQPIGRNNALQALWYLLGWTIPTKDAVGNVTGEQLVAGRGVFPEDINLATFIAGANACEVAGYYTDLVLSTEDDHTSNEDKITCEGLIGRLIDPGGLWSYYANVDDTANIAAELTDADVIQGATVNWNEFKGMSDQYNQVAGKFVNPSPVTLFQAYPYPVVRDAVYEANLGVKRRKTQDFEQVLDTNLAQRLARLLLNQGQYQGEHSANWNYKAGKAQAWSVVRYTSERFGWTKLFRVWRHDISTDGGVGMLLREIHPSIWGAGTVTFPEAPSKGIKYDPRQAIPATGVAIALATVTGTDGSIADAFNVVWDTPPENVRRTETRYRVQGTTYWETVAPVNRGTATGVTLAPLLKGTNYQVQVRHISIHEIEGPWVDALVTSGAVGNVNYSGIANAATTAQWPYVGDPLGTRPENNATVGAPAGTNVAGVPSQTLVGNVNTNAANISAQGLTLNDIIIDVGDLQNIYGDTASAAASAAAAAGALSAANTAKVAAEGARDIALGYKEAAGASAENSEASRVFAVAAQSASEIAKAQAEASATSANDANNAAAGHAYAASQSQIGAASSAVAASASNVSAKLQAAAILPSTLVNKGAYFTTHGFGSGPENAPDISPYVGESVYGPYYDDTALQNAHIGTRGVVPYEAGKSYDIEARIWTAINTGQTAGAWIWVTPMRSDYTLPPSLSNSGGIGVGNTVTGVLNTISILKARFTAPEVPEAVWLRFGVLFNRQYNNMAGIVNGATQRFIGLAVRDATQAKLAGDSASAASLSASSAATFKDNAETAAQSSTDARNEARAARDAADGSADAAAISASLASGSATEAGNKAVAANQSRLEAEAAKEAAGGSAVAANGSAQQAFASAGLAGQKAEAASASAQAADTSAGHAGASQTAAAISENNAQGSASAASASQSLSATNAANAGLAMAKMFPRAVSPQAYTWANTGGTELQRNPPLPDATLVNGAIYLDTASALPVNYPYGIWCRMPVPYIANKAYRVISRLQQLGGASSQSQFYAVYYDAWGTYYGEGTLGAGIALDGSLKDYAYDYICGTSPSPGPGTAYIRLGLVTQRALANIAVTQAGITAVHALYIDDVTSQLAAALSASASAGSSSTASTAKQGAEQSAIAANQSKLEAEAANEAAKGAALAAASSKASADASAASASTSSLLSARMGQGMLNKNPAFADLGYTYDSNGQPLATDWAYWWSAPTAANKVDSPMSPSGKRWQLTAANGQSTGIAGGLFPMRRGYYVLEAEFELGDGSLEGAKIYVSGQQSGVGEIWGGAFFLTDFVEANGYKVSEQGQFGLSGFRRIKGRKLVFLDAPLTVDQGALVAMLSFGPPNPYKYVWLDFVGIRPANPAEISALTVLPSLQASVSSNSAAIATVQGRVLAYWQNTTNAGAIGTFIEARSEASYGAGATSSVSIGAREIHLYNQAATGTYSRAVSVTGGRVTMFGDLDVGGAMRFGARRIPVALQSFTLTANDGQAISFGGDLTNIPKLEPQVTGLPALPSGQSYDIKALSLTSTGFTARQKIVTQGTPSNQNSGAGTYTGGTPAYKAQKPSAGDAVDGNYNFFVSGQVQLYVYGGHQQYIYPDDGGNTANIYVDCYVKRGGQWYSVGTLYTSVSSWGGGGSGMQTFSWDASGGIYCADAIGQDAGGDYEFGIDVYSDNGNINSISFGGVTYQAQGSQTAESAIPQAITYRVVPQNG